MSLNKERLAAADRPVTADDLIDGKYLLVQRGKKNYYLLIVNDALRFCAYRHIKFRPFISFGTFARQKSQMRNSQKEIKGRNCFLGLNVGVLDTFTNLIFARYGKMVCF